MPVGGIRREGKHCGICRYTQTEIAGIGTACNVGGYFALFAGLFYDRFKSYNRCFHCSSVLAGFCLPVHFCHDGPVSTLSAALLTQPTFSAYCMYAV